MKSKDDANLFLSSNTKKSILESHASVDTSPKSRTDKLKDVDSSCKPDADQEGTKQSESCFPVSWLPAMVVPSDSHASYVVDQGEKMSPELISPGTLVQLPSYPGSNAGKVYGIVIGPNTVVPLDSLSLVNMHGYNKIPHSTVNDGTDLITTLKTGSKIDSPTDGESISTSINFGISNVGTIIKDHLFCVYCQKYFKNLAELQNHMITDHSDQQPIGSYFNDSSSIHATIRTGCPGCGHQLRRVPFESDFSLGPTDEYQGMPLSHGGSILMVCDNCDKEYTLGVAHEQSQPQPSQEPPKRHYCEHCDKSYKHNRDLRKHLRSHHGIETVLPNSSSVATFQSDAIQNSASSSFSTPNHSSKIVCQQCKKMFRGPFELRRHVHTVHENKRPYKCPDCSKFFRDAYELKRHSASHQRLHYHNLASSNASNESSNSDMLQLQAGVGRVDSTCPNQAVSRIVSNGIIRDVYSDQQNSSFSGPGSTTQGYDYFCGSCDKNFRGANEFRRHHSVVHEKKFRYKCLHCGKLWRDQYDLKRHCRRSHFVDREIDRSFIRQCLLENNESGSQSQNQLGVSGYDIGQQVTLTLNHEAAAAIFGQSDQDIRNSQSQLDSTFSLLDHNNLSMAQSSPTGGMFSNLPSIQPASMLYHTQDASHLVENMIQPQDSDAIQEETKNAVNWSNFESDIQSQKN